MSLECPACGSNNIQTERVPNGNHLCVKCGKLWKNSTDERSPEGRLWDAGRLTFNPDLALRFESSIDAHEWAQVNNVPMGLLEVTFIAKGNASVYLGHYKMVYPKCNLADGKRVYYK